MPVLDTELKTVPEAYREDVCKLDSASAKKILYVVEQIDKHVSASSPLFDLCKIKEPNYIEKCGAAMILHSFYNGIENIILLITLNKDPAGSSGEIWYRELLDAAFVKTENRAAIFRQELKEPLNILLKFRHVVRHSYGFQLRWEDMKEMVFCMVAVWENVKEDVNAFIENN